MRTHKLYTVYAHLQWHRNGVYSQSLLNRVINYKLTQRHLLVFKPLPDCH